MSVSVLGEMNMMPLNPSSSSPPLSLPSSFPARTQATGSSPTSCRTTSRRRCGASSCSRRAPRSARYLHGAMSRMTSYSALTITSIRSRRGVRQEEEGRKEEISSLCFSNGIPPCPSFSQVGGAVSCLGEWLIWLAGLMVVMMGPEYSRCTGTLACMVHRRAPWNYCLPSLHMCLGSCPSVHARPLVHMRFIRLV